jgi:REP element-mobilizing transposase RayT
VRRKSKQIPLDLRAAPSWGGRRAGAGRRPGPNPRDRPRRCLAARFPCHVTLKVRRELPSLRDRRFVCAFERSLVEACDRARFRVVHYSLQADHVHLIVESASSRDLAAGMKSIGARLARAANRVFHHRGPVLLDRYHLHILRTPREVRNALAYVLLNARRHLAKRGRTVPKTAWIDPASSGRWFDGWRTHRLPEHAEAASVAKPRTWLLLSGWRRHGVLDPTETPGAKRRKANLRGKSVRAPFDAIRRAAPVP